MRLLSNRPGIGARVRRSSLIIASLAAVGATVMTGSSSLATNLNAAQQNAAQQTAAQKPTASATDGSASAPGVFIGVSPVRVLDTRGPAAGGPIGVAQAGKFGPSSKLTLRLAGEGLAVPANATSVLINVTIDEDASLPSYLTIWPAGEAQPFTSANNALPGLIAGNSMLAKLGTAPGFTGAISIYNQRGDVNVIIDLVGYTVPLSSVDLPGGSLFSGNAAPTPAIGSNGDFYIDLVAKVLYGPKTNGEWPTPGINLGGGAAGPAGPAGAAGPAGPAGANGTNGTNGASTLTGAGAPAGGLGTNGDLYVDSANGDLYKKIAGVWTLQGSLKGATGATGPAGGIAAALGTFNDSPGPISPAGAISFPVANDVTVPSASITHAGGAPADFVLTTGTYRVSYRVSVSVGLLGDASAQLTLNGTGVGSTNDLLGLGLASVGAVAQDTVLVKVTGATGTLQLTMPSALNVTPGSASIEIEKVA